MSNTADERRIKLSFRVMGEQLDPNEVSLALRLQPTKCHRRGDPHVGKGGRHYGTFREGLWMLASNAPPEANLQAHLTDLLQRLSGQDAVLQRFRERGLRTDLFVGVFDITAGCGFSLPPQCARSLGELGLTIGFDLYPATEPEPAVAPNSEGTV